MLDQLLSYVGRLVQGDLGNSYRQGGRPVLDLILGRMPATILLAVAGLAVAMLVGIPLGIVAAQRPGGKLDHLMSGAGSVLLALPTFLVGLVRTPWIPIGLAVAVVLAAAGLVEGGPLGTIISAAASILGAWSLFRRFEGLSPGRRGSRWNQRTAAGWVVCVLAASLLDDEGLAAWGMPFKIAGIVVGGALLLLMPRALPAKARR